MNRATTIGWIDGADSDQRMEVALVQREAGELEFVMSEQHYAEGIGWFTQRSLALDPRQVAQLKRLLLVNDVTAAEPHRTERPAPTTLRLVAARAAMEDQPLADVG